MLLEENANKDAINGYDNDGGGGRVIDFIPPPPPTPKPALHVSSDEAEFDEQLDQVHNSDNDGDGKGLRCSTCSLCNCCI